MAKSQVSSEILPQCTSRLRNCNPETDGLRKLLAMGPNQTLELVVQA